MSGIPTTGQHLAEVAPTRIHWPVLALSFLTIVLDGFDTTSISFVVPTLAREWGIAPAGFTPAFVGTSLGAVIGYIISGKLVHRLGSRGAILASVLLFAIGSALTALSSSMTSLALLRLITGIGLGVALPAAIAMASSHAPVHRRETIAVAVAAGLGLGSTLGGVVGGRLIAAFGWQSIFWLGALLPLLLLPFLWFGLPQSNNKPSAVQQSKEDVSVAALFQGALRIRTLLLWTFSFTVFVTLYSLSFWLPTILLNFGFTAVETPMGIASLGMGGLIGATILIPLSAAFGAVRVLVFTSLFATAAIAGISWLELDRMALLFMVGAAGAGLIAGTTGQSGLAVSLYQPSSRATGVGFSAALGRIGSIVGPAVGGALLSFGAPTRTIILIACIPLLVATIAMAILAVLGVRQKGEQA
jgi:AAHS family 4-hydroxybenzoate transporter-like MFS transporter